MRPSLRSTLLASCALTLSFGLLGCEDASKTTPAPATPPSVTAPATPDAGKGGAMDGPAPRVDPAPTPAPAPEPK